MLHIYTTSTTQVSVLKLREKQLGTWPASISVWNFLAAIPDDVKIAAPFPYLHKWM